MAATQYTLPPMSLTSLDHDFRRADIEFHGVDHAEASYEARVFLNNPTADDQTERTADQGYAGSFHIFGHGGCFGDEGHCEINGPRRRYDPRPEHPLTPATKRVIATGAVRRAVAQGDQVVVTIVPIVTSATDRCDMTNVLKFQRLKIVTYR